MSNRGLRVLAMASRHMSMQEFRQWQIKYRATKVKGTEEQLKADIEQLECNMQLLGATCLMDWLQSGVTSTIGKMKEAGIKIWMQTGDKMETAIKVAQLSGLIKLGAPVFQLKEKHSDVD